MYHKIISLVIGMLSLAQYHSTKRRILITKVEFQVEVNQWKVSYLTE
jgi:hypothetical protein